MPRSSEQTSSPDEQPEDLSPRDAEDVRGGVDVGATAPTGISIGATVPSAGGLAQPASPTPWSTGGVVINAKTDPSATHL